MEVTKDDIYLLFPPTKKIGAPSYAKKFNNPHAKNVHTFSSNKSHLLFFFILIKKNMSNIFIFVYII